MHNSEQKHMHVRKINEELQTVTGVWMEITVMIGVVNLVCSNNRKSKYDLVGKEHLLETHVIDVVRRELCFS